eukprot:TRINITY_DN4627_c0_g1_i1.p1 TRINITY_DN4627_c0_g1~~TRINITY_DN4627_c0_g1_i1.p1  ORF type:complete len:219 (+),score=29.41 TRINITY_DN4627_c0_g1_i1:400-1056(+)
MKRVCEVDMDELPSCSVSTCLGERATSYGGLHCSGSWKLYSIETETGQSHFKSDTYSCVGRFDFGVAGVECDGLLQASRTESSKLTAFDFGSEEVWTQIEEYFKAELYEPQEEEDQLETLVENVQIQLSFEDVNEQSTCDDEVYCHSLALNCMAKRNGKAYCENFFFPCVGDFEETCDASIFEGVLELEAKCEGTHIPMFHGSLCLGSYEMSYTQYGE